MEEFEQHLVENNENKDETYGLISMILGVVSLVSSSLGLPCAVAAIVLACLDRSKNDKMTDKAKIGLIIGIIVVGLNVVVTILALVFVVVYCLLGLLGVGVGFLGAFVPFMY